MLRRNPLAALSLHRPSSAPPQQLERSPSDLRSSFSEPGDESADEEASQLIATRGGQVLGPYSILKEDHFPGEFDCWVVRRSLTVLSTLSQPCKRSMWSEKFPFWALDEPESPPGTNDTTDSLHVRSS